MCEWVRDVTMRSFSALWLTAASLLMAAELSAACISLTTTKITTCHTLQRLSCEHGVISVQSVLYGRLDKETCSEESDQRLSNVSCAQTGAIDIMKARCDEKSSCEVLPGFFTHPDPCPGTSKYLETTYACVLSGIVPHISTVRSVACEHSIAHLRCGEGTVIHVTAADYGRRDATTCSLGRSNEQLQNAQCSAAALDKVEKICNGRTICSVKAKNSVFGDPCYGTYKNLQVEHVCRSASAMAQSST